MKKLMLLLCMILNFQVCLILTSDKNICASRVDLCYLQNLKNHIYD